MLVDKLEGFASLTAANPWKNLERRAPVEKLASGESRAKPDDSL
jgi:hypothetical protein